MQITRIRNLILILMVSFSVVCAPLLSHAMEENTQKMLQATVKFAAGQPADVAVLKELKSLSSASDDAVYSAIRRYARDMMTKGRYTDVFYLCWRVVRYEQPVDKSIEKVRFMLGMYLLLGASASEIGMTNISMEYYTYGLALAEKHHEEQLEAQFLNNIGVCYFNLADYKTAREYLIKAMAINKRYNLNYDVFLTYNNLSEIDRETGNLDDALSNSLMAMQYLERAESNDPLVKSHKSYIYTQIARLYIKKNDFVLARTYLENGLNSQRKDASKSDVFESCLLFSELYMKTGELDSARTWAEEATREIRGTGNLLREIRAHEQLAEISERRGDYKHSSEHLHEAFLLRDSLQNQENKSRMEQLKQIYDMDRESLIYRASTKNTTPGLFRTLSVVLGVLLLITMALLGKWIRDKRRLKAGLQAKLSEEAREREEQRRRFDEVADRARQMQESLDTTHRQLTTFTMQKLRTSENQAEIISDMRRLLATINPRSKELRDDVQSILSKLSRARAGDDWQEFHYYFEKVNPTFYSRLMAAHPDITEKEKRLCALLALGMNTKEIANITYREVRSVESSRMRLRKKLGLLPDEDLNTYCQSFTDAVGEYCARSENSECSERSGQSENQIKPQE